MFVETIRQLVASAIEKGTAEKGRIERAAAIVLLSPPVYEPSLNAWIVQSQREDDKLYQVPEKADGSGLETCSCVDAAKAPAGWCKHRLAVAMLQHAADVENEIAAKSARQERRSRSERIVPFRRRAS
ncbi:MAG: hypothetical protein IT201_14550 [Thermoleophilia bacterium]|nr:hypothetical protein [Thermoleophilia bacterium]